ncbi:MAG: hypothetical protein WD059_11615 [Balneolaceae bacterium]
MKKIFITILFLVFTLQLAAQENPEYTLVTYNIENLFDADGEAIFNDYKPTDRDGKPQYTPAHVLTKIKNAIRVLKEYNKGRGPDIIAMIEMESDFTPTKDAVDVEEFLVRYSSTSLEKMLSEDFNDEIADLPSELLLLKGMVDSGMWEYEMAVGESKKNSRGEPESVQKTVTYSRFPIKTEHTKMHHLERARPILETWIDVDGNDLVVFNNHWKSGASSWDMEQVRLGNAKVLRERLDDLIVDIGAADFILAGDFNSDYNQKARYDFEQTAVNGILKSTGDEALIASGETAKIFNLWYEWPIDRRGSDTYRGKWGTLMQLMISPGMYDEGGLQYVDDSFSVGDFGFNTHSSSGEPKRWSSTFSGSGFSDHLPISMKFRVAETQQEFSSFSVNDDEQWKPIDVQYQQPAEFITEEEFLKNDPTTRSDFFDEYVYLKAAVSDDYKLIVNDVTYDVYAPAFQIKEVLGDIAGTDKNIHFYGRFSQFRGNWQFVVESADFITKEE